MIRTLTCSSHTNLPPDVTLSSDFIAGFCGETEADHEETLSLMKLVRFDAAYLFAYSMRKVRIQSSLPLIRSSKLTASALTVPFPPPPHAVDLQKTHAYHHYKDDVPEEAKQRRLKELIAVHQRIASEKNAARIGSEQLVLIQGVSRKCTHIYTQVYRHTWMYAHTHTHHTHTCTHTHTNIACKLQ